MENPLPAEEENLYNLFFSLRGDERIVLHQGEEIGEKFLNLLLKDQGS